MKYFIGLCLFALIASSLTMTTRPLHVDNIPNGISDTLPETVYIYDTITTFNSDTYVETIKVVRSKVILKDHVSAINLSGKNSTLIDTLVYFDNIISSEIVDENTTTLPVELWPIFYKLRKQHEKN